MDRDRSSSDSSGEKVENTQVELELESKMGNRYHSHTIRLYSIREMGRMSFSFLSSCQLLSLIETLQF